MNTRPRRGRISLYLKREAVALDIAPQPSTYLHDHGAAIDWMDFHMREMLSKRADSRAGESRLRSSNGRGAIVIVLALFDPHDDAQLIWS